VTKVIVQRWNAGELCLIQKQGSMSKKWTFLLLAALTFSVSAWAQQNPPAGIPKHRVVLQVTSPDTLVWKGLIKNIQHLKEAWGDQVQLEVVAHGGALGLLVKNQSTQAARIAEFVKEGVVFVACQNTMRERHVEKSDLLPEAGLVPSGIGEVVLKQEAGWSYLKIGF
jgi:intracellular sulfur oxidation DsrE/DsrF family protein